MALLLTVPMSLENRLSRSPLVNWFIDSQSASMILSKMSAWMSLPILMPSFVVMRLITL